jgi:hypothetical protein
VHVKTLLAQELRALLTARTCAGSAAALAPVVDMVSEGGEPVNVMYFWATGILSSFLDNAPTYLVFFNTAGDDAELNGTPLDHLARDFGRRRVHRGQHVDRQRALI